MAVGVIEKVFASAEDSPYPIYRPLREQPEYHIEAQVYSDHGNMMCIGYKGPSGLTQEAIDLCVLREIMNDSTKGWLKDGPGTRTEAVWNRGKHQALFAMVVWLKNKSMESARSRVEDLLRRKPTPAEVQRAKDSLALAWATTGSSRETAEDLAECVALGNPLDYFGRIDALDKSTPDSVYRTMVDYFQTHRQALVHMTRGGKHARPDETPLRFKREKESTSAPILYPFKPLGTAENLDRIFVSYCSGKAFLVEHIACSDGAEALAMTAYPVVGGVQREIKHALGGILVIYTFPEGISAQQVETALNTRIRGNAKKASVEMEMKLHNSMDKAAFVFSAQMPPHFGQHQASPSVPASFEGSIVRVSYTGPKDLFQIIRGVRQYKFNQIRYPPPAQSKGKFVERTGFGKVTWVRAGWLVPFDFRDPRFRALKVAVAQLGLGMQCDVMQELRIKQNLTYTAAAQCQPVGSSTMIVCSASFANGKYHEGVDALKGVIGRWLKEGLKENWAAECCNHGFLGLDGRRMQAQHALFPYYQTDFLHAYNKVTSEEVQEALKGLSLDNLTVVCVGTLE